MRVELPWPPSVNHYWRRKGAQYFIDKPGKLFREHVWYLLKAAGIQQLDGDLAMTVDLHPPDYRVRDCDNTLKAIGDALKKGGAYFDDSQLKKITVEMLEPRPKAGCAIVTIEPYVPREAA